MFNVGQRPDVADIVVVITDGRFDDPNATWVEAMDTRAQNISIITVSGPIYTSNDLRFFSCRRFCMLQTFSATKLSQPSLASVSLID